MAESMAGTLMPFRPSNSISFLDENGDLRNHSKYAIAPAHRTAEGAYATKFDLDDYGFRHRYALSREYGIKVELSAMYPTPAETFYPTLCSVAIPPDEVREIIEAAQDAGPRVISRSTFNVHARPGRHSLSRVELTLAVRKSEVFVESVTTIIPPDDVEYMAELLHSWAR